ncbi:MAG: sulfurtransferase complex subunit TusC [Gammaproteobacteria bacterium]|nr:sulfurtransferase complex subunit TusC [Gammaproteobacteria bacterium]
MCINRRAPHGTVYALEGLEVVLVAAAFQQDVSIAFVDDGIYQLKTGQNAEGLGVKIFAPAFRVLKHYDITNVFVERESLGKRGLTPDDLLIEAQVLDRDMLVDLIEQQDVILNF